MEAKPIKVPNLTNIIQKVKSFSFKSWISDFKHQVILAAIYALVLATATGIYAANWYKSISVPDYVQNVQDSQTIQKETAEYVNNALNEMTPEDSQILTQDSFSVGKHTVNTNISSLEGGYFDCMELDPGVYLIYYYRTVDDSSVVSAMVSIGKNLTSLYAYTEEPVAGTNDVWLLDFSQGEITFEIS